MATKIEITEKQLKEFNGMRLALLTISKDFETPNQIRRNCTKEWGLEYKEALEMSYENIQECAKNSVKNVKALKC